MSERPRMRRVLPVAGWGAFLLVLAAVSLIFRPDGPTVALAFGSAAAALLAGLTVLRSRRTPPPTAADSDIREVPDLSPATVLAAAGVAVAISGLPIGSWLIGIGAGLTLAGVAGLVREERAERRERRAAAAEAVRR